MYREIETWLNYVLDYKIPSQIPSSIKAFCFNLYEDKNDDWSMDIEANGEALVRDFVLFCLQGDMTDKSDIMPASNDSFADIPKNN